MCHILCLMSRAVTGISMEKIRKYILNGIVISSPFILGSFPVLSTHGCENKVVPAAVQSRTVGVLVLAHGMHAHDHENHTSKGTPAWNASVLEAVQPIEEKYPLEVAFGMADPATIQESIQKLEKKGVTDVIVVPLFISSHSPIIGNSRYILGLQGELPRTTDVKSLPRLESKVTFHMTEALNDSILVAEILLERAKELSTRPDEETVILVGHGPNDEDENRL